MAGSTFAQDFMNEHSTGAALKLEVEEAVIQALTDESGSSSFN